MEFTEDLPQEPVEDDSYFVYGYDLKTLPDEVTVTGLVIVLRLEAPDRSPAPFLVAKESPNVADWEARSMLAEALAMFRPEEV